MRLRALIIDDDPVFRRTMMLFLGQRNYEILSFPSPGHCPINVANTPMGVFADVIFSDLEMPGMTGLDLVDDLLKKGFQCPAVALISGVWTEERYRRALALGCRPFSKPVQTEELKTWLDEVERNVRPNRVLADWNALPTTTA